MTEHNYDFPIPEITDRPRNKPGHDFAEFMQEARKDPAVAEYLDSFAVFVGNMVLVHRQKAGLTQSELAKRAHTTQARISQIEAGFGGVKLDTVDKVCKALAIQLFDPMQREDAPSKLVSMV
ncbi:helix-turn-helix transcriptional regulator [Paenibacillus alkaliterrae]|uniref:helix-turn-helix domain-containing protein n=1 Tax=Paenibacillus alkaliterrae TaxID=320909 RepID=UPI001F29712B|nr:helix-turn-helix transcriptional regulator [Paenibacillus alkaliterrae]MCF2939745.1 helix-turn-helix transcriptional regulator [Paenibacillus alkaliterrae]